MQSKAEPSGTVVINGAEYKYGVDVAEQPAKLKTGRRESARKATLHEGPRVGRAAACGHAVVANSAPHTKCFDCWHLYFSTNVKQTYALFSFLENGREAELVAVHGSKFVAQFKHYVEHVQNLAPIEADDAVAKEGLA